jgi:hypothetical protein
MTPNIHMKFQVCIFNSFRDMQNLHVKLDQEKEIFLVQKGALFCQNTWQSNES